MKKIIMFLCMILTMGISAQAYELPNSFWQPNTDYANAVSAGNNQDIIKYGEQILDIIKDEPENTQTLEIKGSRLEQVGLAYERLGDFQSARNCFFEHITVSEKLDWKDAVKISKAKVLQYTTDVRVYKGVDKNVHSFYAKHEPERGVLFGLPSDSPVRDSVSGRSAILLYQEFGAECDNGWNRRIFEEARQNGQVIEFAWNLPGQGGQLNDVLNNDAHIISVLKFIENYSDVPVFIRFAAEFNIWDIKADKNEFINAFKKVSTLARQYTTNTAMVWSVNEVSEWTIDMNDYYPGDEYVDWIGVSLYAKKYFQGIKDWSDAERFNEVVFNAGINADPVKALDEVITKFGARKPIMIAESGASHFVRTVGEDHTEWANMQLEKLYHYVPMVYPQVKFIAHFDKVISYEINDYALSSNNSVLTKYKQLVKAPHMINKDFSNKPIAYEHLAADNMQVGVKDDLYTYVHYYSLQKPSVQYYIDGEYAGTAWEIPYKFPDLENIETGTHKLEVKVECGGKIVAEECKYIDVVRNIDIFVDNRKIESDTMPVIKNGRTLVPVRFVANALGADVSWNQEQRSVTVKKGNDTLILKIDDFTMLKNSDSITLDVPPEIINDRTMIPIRAISEAFDAKVDWDAANSAVIITSGM